jgi:hypothetical protein
MLPGYHNLLSAGSNSANKCSGKDKKFQTEGGNIFGRNIY